MKVLYGGKVWEWRFGSERLKESFKLINPKEKVYLNGNGSGICMMAPIVELNILFESRKERMKK